MKLIYESTGKEVKEGDVTKTANLNTVTILSFSKPHKPSSEGKVTVKHGIHGPTQELYVGVIGAKWIDREDQQEPRVPSPSNTGARPFHASTRVTDEEDKVLRAASTASGKSHADWLRDVLMAAAVEQLEKAHAEDAKQIFGE